MRYDELLAKRSYLDSNLSNPMTLTIQLSTETTRKLRELAVQAGQSVEGYVEQLVERQVVAAANGQQTTARSPTWAEVCAPIAEAVSESGMSDDEVAGFFTEVRDEVRAEKQAKRPQGQTTE
jgi:hypothetical protein